MQIFSKYVLCVCIYIYSGANKYFRRVFGVIVVLEDPATTHLQCSYRGKEVVGQNLTIHGPIHPPLNTVQSSSPLCREAPPKHDVSTPMLHGWDYVLGIVLILLPPNTASGVYTKMFYFGLIWPHDLLPCLFWIIQMVFGNLQTGLDMSWLEQGDLELLPSHQAVCLLSCSPSQPCAGLQFCP